MGHDMRQYMLLIIGIILLSVAFVWMVIAQSSTGPFLVLGSISAVVIVEGIYRIKNKKS